MRRLILVSTAWLLLLGPLHDRASAHRAGDPPHQLYQMGDLTLENGKVITLIMTGTKDLLNPEWEPLEAAKYIRDVRTVPINPDSITGHFAAGGFIPADVEQINMETERLLDIVTQRGAKFQ